jgi:hypothetical protein
MDWMSMIGGAGGGGGGASMGPYGMLGQGVSQTIGDLASGIGGYFLGKEESDSYKDAAREQLRQLIEMAQWGWGYPEWMKQQIQRNVGLGTEYADLVGKRYDEMAPLYNKGFGENPLRKPTEQYTRALEGNIGSIGGYKNLAASNWNQARRGLEASGMAPRERVSAMRELSNRYADARQQADIQGNQERLQNLSNIYGARSGLANAEYTQAQQERQMKQWYANRGLEVPGIQQGLQLNPMAQAISLPNRSPGSVPWPGMDSPSLWPQMLAMFGKMNQNWAEIQGASGAFGAGNTQGRLIDNPGSNYGSGVAPGSFQAGSPAAAAYGKQLEQLNYQPYTYSQQAFTPSYDLKTDWYPGRGYAK